MKKFTAEELREAAERFAAAEARAAKRNGKKSFSTKLREMRAAHARATFVNEVNY